ncbi:MAG: alpha/beta hydrolase [Bdellovibrionales bacterium]
MKKIYLIGSLVFLLTQNPRWVFAFTSVYNNESSVLGILDRIDNDKTAVSFVKNQKIKLCELPTHECFFKSPRAPYVIAAPKPTNKTALMFHGLTDSPFYMKDIAETYHKLGFNVVVAQLSGHSSEDPTPLLTITFKDWIQDFNNYIQFVKKNSTEIHLVGFSTGASLVLNAISTYADINHKIKSAVLLSPTLDLDLGTRLSIALSFASDDTVLSEKDFGYGIRYQVQYVKGISELKSLNSKTKKNFRNRKRNRNYRQYKFSKIPVYALIAGNDSTYNIASVLVYLTENLSNFRYSIFGELMSDTFVSTFADGDSTYYQHILDLQADTKEIQPMEHLLKNQSIEHNAILLDGKNDGDQIGPLEFMDNHQILREKIDQFLELFKTL